MRLHNRQVKAAFWTDTDLIRLLDIPGRMFYQGLWQLADDSGCLEYDVLAFKIHLFPADPVSTETIQEWINKLVESKKLIEYEVGNKKCLFLKNFHKHQTLKNCPPPEVPLPPWITFEAFPSNNKQGKYIVNEDILNDFLHSSYYKKNINEDSLQPSYNQNQNQNLNHNQNRNQYIESDSENPTSPADPQNEENQSQEIQSDEATPQEAIFEHWNSKDIIKHRKMTDKIKRAINGALRDYTKDEICQAIDNYALILSDEKYYWTHKWTLKEFLERGLDKFFDFETAAQNYAKGNEKTRGDPGEPKSWGTLRHLYEKYKQEEADEFEKNRNGPTISSN